MLEKLLLGWLLAVFFSFIILAVLVTLAAAERVTGVTPWSSLSVFRAYAETAVLPLVLAFLAVVVIYVLTRYAGKALDFLVQRINL
ncbi:hypothetical protein [Thermofilum pendens]|uniref:Uncharacterized protein n=1 Tax=Thermofilum pendens (strain DSM 2475 / Hrk 5) TaxID=368408 RepID=A1RW55_THEPD|nr:hypothetical protein [Thermofilum pendens]ABL77435.1 hypothetical protein Tpen_0025 [Thermofilum pendens Hrk 5]